MSYEDGVKQEGCAVPVRPSILQTEFEKMDNEIHRASELIGRLEKRLEPVLNQQEETKSSDKLLADRQTVPVPVAENLAQFRDRLNSTLNVLEKIISKIEI